MADLIASSANILQCNFIGGKLRKRAISVFFTFIASINHIFTFNPFSGKTT